MARVPYAEVPDVQARLPEQMLFIDGDSQPSESRVGDMLEAASGWIDSTLRWRYTVPITHVDDLMLLRQACAALVAAQCWQVISASSPDFAAIGKDLRKEAMVMLAYDERTGRSALTLPNSTLSETGEASIGQPDSTFTDPDDGGDARSFEITSVF